MARSMDLLRATWAGFNATEHLQPFQEWVNGVLMKQVRGLAGWRTPPGMRMSSKVLHLLRRLLGTANFA